MDIPTLITEIIKAVAWPATTIYLILQFKVQILSLFDRVVEGSLFGHSVKFSPAAKDFLEKPSKDPTARSFWNGSPFQAALDLVEISPQSAVIETWKVLHDAALARIHFYPEADSSDDYPTRVPRPADTQKLLKEHQVLNDSELGIFSELRKIRNLAVHETTYRISSDQARDYIQIADGLLERINPPKEDGD